MVTFSKEELNYIASQTLPYLLEMARSSSLEIDDVDIIDDYSGITSMPAYDNGGGLKRIVRVPLSVFAKPAEDAVAEVSDAIEQALEATEKATQFIEEAETLRNDIAKALKDAQDSVIIAQTALGNTNEKLEGLDEKIEAAGSAADIATEAATHAQSVAEHPTYIGSDYYVYQWDYSKKSYVKSNTYVKGENGETPIFQQGTTTTLNPSDSAEVKVTQTGTSTDGSPIYRLDFSIPKGEKGQNGSGSGNVLVDTSNLQSSKTYLFKPKQNGSAEGTFVEYEIPDIDTSTLVTDSELTEALKSKQDSISDLDSIRSGASKGATAVQPSSLHKVATSGSYNDLTNKPTIPAEQVNADWNATSGKARILNKPTIPSAVTESTVSGWGFTKNTGTYSKPSTGIPKNDLASSVQTSLGKADTALQSHQDISGKQDKIAIVNHGTRDTTFTLTPNVLHVWGAVTKLTITLGTANNATMDEFMFQFTSGSTATTLSLPEDINWVVTPSINPNKVYQCSIINNVGVIAAANLG